MALTDTEQLVLEAIKSMLQDNTKLGLKQHEDDEYADNDWRGLEYLHNTINDMFRLEAIELTHSEGVCQAFSKVHSYKYLDDPTFEAAMEKEMVAQAVPAAERAKAKKIIPKIIKKIKEEKEWAEKDSSFNPNLEEIKNVSKPEQPLDFEIHDVDGYSDKNVMSKMGEASPSRTPDGSANRL